MVLNWLKRPLRVNYWNLIAVALLAAFSFFNIIVPGISHIAGFFKWFTPFLGCACYCMTLKDTKSVWIKYVNLMFVIALISLVLYFLGSVTHILSPTRIAKFLYDEKYKFCGTYFNFQYESQRVQLSSFLGVDYRNCCFFLEAPMYNLVLCIAFAAEMAFQPTVRKPVIIVLAISILTTFTTTGMLFLMAMAILYIWNSGNSRAAKYLKWMMIPAAIAVAAYVGFSMIAEKKESAAGGESFSVRIDHFFASFKMWAHNPIIGYGFGNADAFYQFTKYKQGFSIGLPAFLGRTGLPMFLLYLIPFVQRTMRTFRHNRKQIYFWAGTFICFFLTASVYKLIFILLICTQIMWKEKENGNALLAKLQEVKRII